MDRGAARSRKRALKPAGPAGGGKSKPETSSTSTSTSNSKSKSGKPRDQTSDSKSSSSDSKPKRPLPKPRIHPSEQSKDPALYTATAIRNSTALIYASAPFALPPDLTGVTRLDLAGSGVEDVSFLRGSRVTWLSIKGCPVTKGWDALAELPLQVLNISECGLSQLPAELKGLTGLKALVAMGNEWEGLDGEVVGAWGELNSLIISHSPNLTALPAALATLPHLAKMTFSHCPRLGPAGLPDLSALPLLRDVRANNLPRLDKVPAHMSTWGTGDMALARKPSASASASASSTTPATSSIKSKDSRDSRNTRGSGLEVLDLGNCALTLPVATAVFGLPRVAVAHTLTKPASNPRWSHLRSLTLQNNPLAVDAPSYADLLRSSPDCPRLQIIDSRRVVERKNKGAVPETRAERAARERREGTGKRGKKVSGANGAKVGVRREWGKRDGDEGEEKGEGEAVGQGEREERGGGEKQKRKRGDKETRDRDARAEEPSADADANQPAKKRKRKHAKGDASDVKAVKETKESKESKTKAPQSSDANPTTPSKSTKPAKSTNTPQIKTPKPVASTPVPVPLAGASTSTGTSTGTGSDRDQGRKRKRESGAAKVEIVRSSGESGKRGVDLKSVFARQESGSGLGMGGGGW